MKPKSIQTLLGFFMGESAWFYALIDPSYKCIKSHKHSDKIKTKLTIDM